MIVPHDEFGIAQIGLKIICFWTVVDIEHVLLKGKSSAIGSRDNSDHSPDVVERQCRLRGYDVPRDFIASSTPGQVSQRYNHFIIFAQGLLLLINRKQRRVLLLNLLLNLVQAPAPSAVS